MIKQTFFWRIHHWNYDVNQVQNAMQYLNHYLKDVHSYSSQMNWWLKMKKSLMMLLLLLSAVSLKSLSSIIGRIEKVLKRERKKEREKEKMVEEVLNFYINSRSKQKFEIQVCVIKIYIHFFIFAIYKKRCKIDRETPYFFVGKLK